MIPLKMAIPEVFDHNLLEIGAENSTVIYCDMDGVLVDFDEGFKKISGGISAEQFDATGRSPEIWKLIFTNPPDNGITWWATLPKLPDGDTLWRFINSLKFPVKILSSTSSKKSKTNNAEIGKRRWLSTNLVPVPPDENVILVDSSESNIAQWRSKGGTAIEHKNTTDTINQLKKILGITQESYGYSWSNI
jgi:hypothetical protein